MGIITLLPFLLVPGLIAAGMVWLLVYGDDCGRMRERLCLSLAS